MQPQSSIRCLLIDNYDSYTHNLYQLLGEVNGVAPQVLRNNEIDWPQLSRRLAAGEIDSIVISPGPGTPNRAADIGICRKVFAEAADVPVLGVCLGLQALAVAHGATVRHAPYPVHGRLSGVEHNGHELFSGIPSGPDFAVVRYHSLAVDETTLPACLQSIAWARGVLPSQPPQRRQHQNDKGSDGIQRPPSSTAADSQQHASGNGTIVDGQAGHPALPVLEDPVLMGLVHRQRPHYAVQFHPESIATLYGIAVLQNFRDLTMRHLNCPSAPPLLRQLQGPPGGCMPPAVWTSDRQGSLDVRWHRLPRLLAAAGGSAAIFEALHGADPLADTFWLDSAATDRARFSYFGGRGGPLWQRVTYSVPAGGGDDAPGSLTIEDVQGQRSTQQAVLWDFLEGVCTALRCRVSKAAAAALPFDFWGGLVGYLGYELKAQCGGAAAHASDLPDAALFCADRLVVADHKLGDVFVVALAEVSSAANAAAADSWLAVTAAEITRLAAAAKTAPAANDRVSASQQQAQTAPPNEVTTVQQQHASSAAAAGGGVNQLPHGSTYTNGSAYTDGHTPARAGCHWPNGAAQHAPATQLHPRHSKAHYLRHVQQCLQALHDGESYELCLTTTLAGPTTREPWPCYLALRQLNPAPYGAWLAFDAGGPKVCCSSPERFLRGGRGHTLEARPIKGTAARSGDPEEDAALAAALAASEKDRAENLMIVDLLRNDLGRVCELGSVHVPGLMEVESFATVHQLVSTVRGLRRQDVTMVQAIRAAFPGGSMTGAPKLRSMQILDGLEGGPRGVYSGCIGFIGFNDTFDLNIVIRTAVFHGGHVTIGAGGAIVVGSDPKGEHDEMKLKARALVQAVGAK